MSRIGKQIIDLPSSVEVEFQSNTLKVTGQKGFLVLRIHKDISLLLNDRSIVVKPTHNGRRYTALWGLTRVLVSNMVIGVTQGYNKLLIINGTGYKVIASDGKYITLRLGYSHDILYSPPSGIQLTCPKDNEILVSGCDKAMVGQIAAEIRSFKKPEPYKGKGIKYSDEIVIRKKGKESKA